MGMNESGAALFVSAVLAYLMAMAAQWSGYNPFLWGLIGIVGWMSLFGWALADTQEVGK